MENNEVKVKEETAVDTADEALTAKLAGSMMGRLCLGAAFGIRHTGTAIGLIGGLAGRSLKVVGTTIALGGEVVDDSSQEVKSYLYAKADELKASADEYRDLVSDSEEVESIEEPDAPLAFSPLC